MIKSRSACFYFFRRSLLLWVVFGLVFASQQTVQSVPVAAGLIHHYTGDGTANDSVGTAHGTLINGASYGTGVSGQAFRFDGTDDYMRVNPGNVIPTAGDFTVSLWVNDNVQSNSVREFVSQGPVSGMDGSTSFYFGTIPKTVPTTLGSRTIGSPFQLLRYREPDGITTQSPEQLLLTTSTLMAH